MIIEASIQYGGSKVAHPPSFIWFSPCAFTPQLCATGALTDIFFYWGWYVMMNLSEETKGGAGTPPARALFRPAIAKGVAAARGVLEWQRRT